MQACSIKAACFLPVLRTETDAEPLAVIEVALDTLSTATVLAIERQLRLSAEVRQQSQLGRCSKISALAAGCSSLCRREHSSACV